MLFRYVDKVKKIYAHLQIKTWTCWILAQKYNAVRCYMLQTLVAFACFIYVYADGCEHYSTSMQWTVLFHQWLQTNCWEITLNAVRYTVLWYFGNHKQNLKVLASLTDGKKASNLNYSRVVMLELEFSFAQSYIFWCYACFKASAVLL